MLNFMLSAFNVELFAYANNLLTVSHCVSILAYVCSFKASAVLFILAAGFCLFNCVVIPAATQRIQFTVFAFRQ